MRRVWLIRIAVAAAVLFAAVLLWVLLHPPKVVEVITPVMRNVVELVIDSGFLRANRRADIGSEVAGTARQVLADEGDNVYAGEVLVRLDPGGTDAQVRQALYAVQTAQSQLAATQRGPLTSDVARARAEVAQAQRVNAAQLRAAQQRLRQLQRGGRPEQIAQAQANLAQATAARRQAELNAQRSQLLYSRGAIPRADLDNALTALIQARQAEVAARQSLALARQPATAEEIAAAREEVRAAQATLQESVRIAQANLQSLLSQPRPEDVRVAQARVREAQAALQAEQEEAAKRIIRSPINGLVITRNVEPGQSVTPGVTLMNVSDMSTAEINVDTDENNLPRLQVGQQALVISPAYRDQPFRATLTQIGPQINTERGVVPLKLRPVSLPDYARPDMTVDVNIEVRRVQNALSVPVTAVVSLNNRAYVMAAVSGRAVRVPVNILAQSDQWAAIEGISPMQQVILKATEVSPGERVRVRGSR